MAHRKKNNSLPTDEELFAQYEILKAKAKEGIPSSREHTLVDLEDTLNSLRNLRQPGINHPGRVEADRLLLARVKDRMLFLQELQDWEKGKQRAEDKPQGRV